MRWNIVILVLAAILIAKTTIYIDNRGEIPSLYMISVEERLPSNITYILGDVKESTTNITLMGLQKEGYVEETVTFTHHASIINSKLKNASIKIDGSYSNDVLDMRIRGSVSMVLMVEHISIPIYLRDMDLHIITDLRNTTAASIKGFVILPLPPKLVENLLLRMKNVIENKVSALGMYIEEFKYKVERAKIFTKVDLLISGKVVDKNIKNMLNVIKEMGANKASFTVTLFATTTKLNKKGTLLFLTKVKATGKGIGITMNKTLENIIKSRIRMVENITDVNVRKILDHVTASKKYKVDVIINYIGSDLKAKVIFNGVYLKPDFWKPLWEVVKEKGINVIVLCPSGEKVLTGPRPPC